MKSSHLMNCFTVCEKLLISYQKKGSKKYWKQCYGQYLNLRNVQQRNKRKMTDFLDCAVHVACIIQNDSVTAWCAWNACKLWNYWRDFHDIQNSGSTLKVITFVQFMYYKIIIPSRTEAQMKSSTLILISTNFTFTGFPVW